MLYLFVNKLPAISVLNQDTCDADVFAVTLEIRLSLN